MAPTDTDQETVSRPGLADVRRGRAARRLRRIGVVLAVAVVVAAAAFGVVAWSRDGRSDDAGPSTDRHGTTSTTRSSTTAPTTTSTLPPPPTSVPGVTVGPLAGGPGPIPLVHRVPTTDPVVFITIDDGATAEADGLTVIRDQHVPVTLFLNQTYLKANADYFRELQGLGAVIGSHTMSHANLRGKDPAFQHAQICDLVPEFQGRFGAVPDLFRPPYGNYDAVTLQEAASCGVKVAVHWSATGDSGHIVTADGPLRAGDIILLHFKPGLGLRLRSILGEIQAAGLRPAQLADYLRSAPPAPPAAPTTTVVAPPESGNPVAAPAG